MIAPTDSRESYDAYVAARPPEHRWQFWPVPWNLATRREKIVKVALWFGQGIALAAALMGAAALDSMLIDTHARTSERIDQCFRTVASGIELRDCR